MSIETITVNVGMALLSLIKSQLAPSRMQILHTSIFKEETMTNMEAAFGKAGVKPENFDPVIDTRKQQCIRCPGYMICRHENWKETCPVYLNTDRIMKGVVSTCNACQEKNTCKDAQLNGTCRKGEAAIKEMVAKSPIATVIESPPS